MSEGPESFFGGFLATILLVFVLVLAGTIGSCINQTAIEKNCENFGAFESKTDYDTMYKCEKK